MKFFKHNIREICTIGGRMLENSRLMTGLDISSIYGFDFEKNVWG